MVALLLAVAALVCFILAVVSAEIGVNLIALGLAFMAAWAIVSSPAVSARVR